MIESRLIRVIAAWAAAVVTAYLLASTFATAAVVFSLRDLGVPLGVSDVLYMTVHDWRGMTGIFLPVVAIGYAVALPAAAAVSWWRPGWRTALFILAGAAALICVHLALKASFGITPVAVARTLSGMTSQALAGAAGGGLFVALRRRW